MRRESLPKRLQKWEPVVVWWDDAKTTYGPVRSADLAGVTGPTCVRASIGFVTAYSRERIAIAAHDDRKNRETSEHADCEDVTEIRRPYILRIDRLKPPHPP